MAMVLYKVCQKEFYAKPSWLKNGNGIYCSVSCRNIGRKKGEIISCFLCGKKVYKQRKALKRSKSQNYFCSRICSITWHNGEFKEEKHGNWKQGTFAYKRILERSDRPIKCALCSISNKDLLLAHHIDKNRKNNQLKNLTWLCQNCHHLVHNYPEMEIEFIEIIKSYATS